MMTNRSHSARLGWSSHPRGGRQAISQACPDRSISIQTDLAQPHTVLSQGQGVEPPCGPRCDMALPHRFDGSLHPAPSVSDDHAYRRCAAVRVAAEGLVVGSACRLAHVAASRVSTPVFHEWRRCSRSAVNARTNFGRKW